MALPTYFVHECPTCGRSLEIRVEYLGRLLSCRHCRGQFVASDPADNRPPRFTSESLLRRAEELLALAERSKTARLYQ